MDQDKEMEKYGVDEENDNFEKQAQELIKTGEAKNIDDARKMISTKENKDGVKS